MWQDIGASHVKAMRRGETHERIQCAIWTDSLKIATQTPPALRLDPNKYSRGWHNKGTREGPNKQITLKLGRTLSLLVKPAHTAG